MTDRSKTISVKIGSLTIGGSDHVVIQSMCNIKTENSSDVAAQINRCSDLGAELMRVSVLDMKDAVAIKDIKSKIAIPLVADIHFDHKLALAAIEAGADAIRLNPGNIGSVEGIKAVVEACQRHGTAIRIGVNSGSLDKTIYDGNDVIKAKYLVESAVKHVKILEDLDFRNIVISLKGSSVIETVAAYRLAAKAFPYPLHLGITEAGPAEIGLIRSAAGLSPLLLDGIGNTIRISLSDAPEEEIKACKRLLHDLGLYPAYPTFISCPTCGRTQVDLIPLAKKILAYLEDHHINKTVAIMGCIVNGPGEAKHADLGAAGGKGRWVIFKKGEILRSVDEKDVYAELVKEINQL